MAGRFCPRPLSAFRGDAAKALEWETDKKPSQPPRSLAARYYWFPAISLLRHAIPKVPSEKIASYAGYTAPCYIEN